MDVKGISPVWLRRLRIFTVSFAILAVAFGAFGFFAGPPIAKHFLNQILAEQLHRPVKLGAIHINPYAMSVRVDGVSVGDNQGGEAFGFDELFVDVDIASVIHAAPVVEAFRIKNPRIHVARTAPGRYDISDLLDEWLKPSDKPTPKFSVNNINITGGRIVFDDRPMGRTHEVKDINISLPFISNLAYQANVYTEPAFSAVANGAPISLTGKAKPFAEARESELKLDVQHFDLTQYLAYLPVPLPFTIASGQLDTDLALVFRQAKGETPTLSLAGSVVLGNLRLLEGKAPLLDLAKLTVPLKSVAPLNNQFHFGQIVISGLGIDARTVPGGGLNLLALAKKLAAPAPAAAPKPAGKAEDKKAEDKKPQEKKAEEKKTEPKPLDLALAGLTLEKAALRWKDGPSATLERFELKDIALDTTKKKASVGEAALDGLNVAVTRQADGSIAGLAALGAGADGKAAAPAAPVAGAAPAAKAKGKRLALKPATPKQDGWLVEVAKISIANTGLRLDDKSLRRPTTQTVDIASLKVDGFSTAPGNSANVALALLLNKKGALNVSGPVVMSPLSAKLKVGLRGFELLPLQPYFSDKLNITITKGQINGDGELNLSPAKDGSLAGGFKGDFTLGEFHSVDKANSADFLTWKSLHLGRINVGLKPLSIAVGEVALSDFYARLIVSPQGRLNVMDIVRKEGQQQAAEPAKAAEPKVEEAKGPAAGQAQAPIQQAAQQGPATPVRIDKVTLQGGTVSFTDHFIKPNYSAKLAKIGGRVTGLSSDPASTADMDLRGAYDGAPLTIIGKLNPLAASPALDIKAEVRGVELTPMSPYFGKYAGYALEKGKLSLYLGYKIADRKLEAQNRVFLDQLTFGDKVESPTATKLPVTLAVALLKNRKGEIDINLPISGSLDDPQFSVGGIVVQVIVNLLTKALTSPFALLGSLFGGGEELSYVDFAPGYAALTPDSQKRLENLAKALEDRPALTLEVAGSVDPEKDAEGLRHAWLERRVKARKLAQLVRQGRGAGSVDEVVVDPKEYPDLLAQAYKMEKFPKPRNFIGLTKSLPVEEMEKLMLANAPAGDEEMRELANQRAKAVADWLAAGGKIPADRVYLLPPRHVGEQPKAGAKDKGLARAEFSLK